MPQFGQKMGSLKTLKKTLEKGSGGATWIKYVPKNGSKIVRFLEEPENWVNYIEHFDQVARKSFPCTGEQSCPGCRSGERKSSRYLANALEVDDKGNLNHIALQLPKDLANRLVVRYERNGTITDRDYELIRSGEGLDTIYELDALAPRKRNMSSFTPHDLIQVLEDAYNEVFGADDDDEDEDIKALPKPARARKKSAAAQKVLDDDEDDEDDEDEEPVKPAAKRAAAKKAKSKAPEPEFEPDEDDEDDDEDDDVDVDDDDDDAYDEDTLRNMPLGALRAVARNEFGVNPKGMSQDEIVDAILEAGEPVEDDEGDDEPPF